MMVTPRAHQKEFVDLILKSQYQGLIAFHGMGLGKAQPLSSKVYTPSGPIPMGEVKVGSFVIGMDGLPKRVIGVFPQGRKKIFKVSFQDGSSTLCCDDHLWSIQSPKHKARNQGFKVVALKDFKNDLTQKTNGNRKWQIPVTQEVHFNSDFIGIPPYTMGVLIGDGSLTGKGISFTNASDYIIQKVTNELKVFPTIEVRKTWQDRVNSFQVRLSRTSQETTNPIKYWIGYYSLNTTAHKKRIPKEYKYNTLSVRLGVLNGLLDTDGYLSKEGVVQYTSASKELVEDVIEVVQSLGGTGTLNYKKTNIGTDAWMTTLKIPAKFLPNVISKPQKALRVTPLTKYPPYRTIVSVEEAGEELCQCISVEGEHYLTDSMIVTHNTLTALLIAQYLIGEARKQGFASPKFIIFCPKSAVPTWHAECDKFTPHLKRDMWVIPYSQMKSAIRKITGSVFPFVFLGLDECHYLKTHDTQRIDDFATFLKTLSKTKYGFNGKIMPMTGTPIPNNAAEIYTMWALCTAPNVYEAANRITDRLNFETWRNLFTNQKNVTFKRKTMIAPGVQGFTFGQATSYEGVAEEEKLHQLIAPITHYKRVEDCIDLPDANIQYLKLDLEDDKLLKDANIEMPDAYMSKLERIATAKTPFMVEWVREFLTLGEQLVVFSLFTAPLRILAQTFPKDVRLITGRESMAERTRNIKDFQEKKFKVVVMSYKAGSESLNFQQARNTFYLNFPWNDDTLEQAKARTRRSGQTSITNHYFMMSGENDIRCYERVVKKREANEKVKNLLLNQGMIGQYVENIFEKFAEGDMEFKDLEGLI